MNIAIIPARYASTRFPGKPLVDIQGKTMIQRVVEQVRQARRIERVVVATDDQRILDHVHAFGAEARMTRADHRSGTDRCAELAEQFPDAGIIINVQGDEPFIHPQQIDLLAGFLQENPDFEIATLAKTIESQEELFNPNLVKVVFSTPAGALYFSRQAIPFLRDVDPAEWLRMGRFFRHIGLYGFRRQALLRVSALPPGVLEKAESLEQLRWLEHGWRIAVVETDLDTIGIDAPEDLEKVQKMTIGQTNTPN